MPDLIVKRTEVTRCLRITDPPVDWREFWPGWVVATEQEASSEPREFAEAAVLSQSLIELYRDLTMTLVEVTRGYGSVSGQQGTVRIRMFPGRQHVMRAAYPVFRGVNVPKREDPLVGIRVHQVVVPNRGSVRAYLDQFSDLAAILPAICDQARREFGHEAELCLELYHDPEIKDKYLSLYVRLRRYGADILDRIEHLSQRFEGQIDKMSGYLLITTDFRQPSKVNDAI